MRRRLTLLALWVVGTTAATLVVWFGVRVVDEEVTALPSAVPSASPNTTTPVVNEGSAPSTPSTSTSTTSPASAAATPTTRVPGTSTTAVTASPGPPPPAPPTPTTTTTSSTTPATTRTFNGEGGSATIRFTSTSVELVVATPAAGFAMEVDDEGPERVRVEFRSDDHETRIEASAGDTTARVSESGKS